MVLRPEAADSWPLFSIAGGKCSMVLRPEAADSWLSLTDTHSESPAHPPAQTAWTSPLDCGSIAPEWPA
jgi:hypothetical protein